ncbi:MAG: hypothetical protein ACE5WD_00925 [Candidatus Aminicenantia bacterium]
MRFKKLLIIILIGMAFILFTYFNANSVEERGKTEKQEEVTPQKEMIIPPEVSKVFDENVLTRQPRKDIPITYARTLYLPSIQNKLHTVFLFKMKNSDLGFQEKIEPFEIIPAEQEEPRVSSKMLTVNLNVFLRFYRLEGDNIKEILEEIYLPVSLEEEKESFNPEEENIYTIAYVLPPGNYLLALAVTSTGLIKIGTLYSEFSLPDPLSFERKLETTPIFFVKSIKQISQPETKVKIHRNSFYYSILQMEPKIENIFSPTDTPEIFYYIFGAKPVKPGTRKYNIEIKYIVKKGAEEVIKFAQKYTAPLISHPLPLSFQEKKLDPGKYTLEIEITENVSNLSTKKEVNFIIK